MTSFQDFPILAMGYSSLVAPIREIAILDLTSGSLTAHENCYMLHCNVMMKITNEKKGIFSSFIHTS